MDAVIASDWHPKAWREVLARHPDPHPFLTDWWQRAWWESFADGQLTVLALDDGGDLAGVVALHTSGDGVVRLLGNREVTDYPAAAVAPGRERTAAETLLRRVRDAGWAHLELDNQRADAPFTAAVIAAGQAAGMATAVAPAEAVAVLRLPDHDAWKRSLTRHVRHELARKRRRLERAHPSVRLRTSDANAVARDLDAFIFLHRRAAGAKASFMTARREAFVRRAVAAAHEHGCLRLDVLEEQGERPLAVALGFASRTTHYLYNMAFDPDAAALSPGMMLLAGLIARASGEGLTELDFLRGLERYKFELGAVRRELVRVVVAVR